MDLTVCTSACVLCSLPERIEFQTFSQLRANQPNAPSTAPDAAALTACLLLSSAFEEVCGVQAGSPLGGRRQDDYFVAYPVGAWLERWIGQV